MDRRQRWVTLGVGLAAAVGAISIASSPATADGRPRTDALVELGRRLFFDPAVSRSGDNACASCHDPEHGFSSAKRLDDDDFAATRRHSQTLLDAADGRAFHWDGEFGRVEDLVTARLGTPPGRRSRHGRAPLDDGGTTMPDGGDEPPPYSAPPPSAPPTPPAPAPAATPPAADPQGQDPASTPPAAPPGTPPPSATGGGSGSAPSSDDSSGYVNPCAPVRHVGGSVRAGLRDPTDDTGTPAPTSDAPPPTDASAPGYGTPPPSETPTTPDGGGTAMPPPPGGDATGSSSTGGYPAPDSSAPSAPTPGGNGSSPSAPTPPVPGTPAPATGRGWSDGGPSSAGGTHGHDREGGDAALRKLAPVADRVEKDGRYESAFRAAFDSPRVTTARIAQAIAAFVRSARSTEAPYDRFARGDTGALSDAAQRGLVLFKGRAGCVQCHAMEGARAPFTDRRYHDTGIAMRGTLRPGLSADGRPIIPALDDGRAFLSHAPTDVASFKTPTLRDVALRPPYMHDGSFRTLAEVVRYYARGLTADPRLDARLKGFTASDRDVADLVAFLESITGDMRPALAPMRDVRALHTVVRFEDARGHAIAGVNVALTPVGDRLPGAQTLDGSAERTLTTNADGEIEFAPGNRTHVRLDLPDGLRAPQGGWIPDSCEALTLRLPVEGVATLLLVGPSGDAAVARLAAVTESRPLEPGLRTKLAEYAPQLLDGLRRRVATFTREASLDAPGKRVTVYKAWVPAGAPEQVLVDVPTATGRRTETVRLVAGAETRLDVTH